MMEVGGGVEFKGGVRRLRPHDAGGNKASRTCADRRVDGRIVMGKRDEP